jgi:hypothetical protein
MNIRCIHENPSDSPKPVGFYPLDQVAQRGRDRVAEEDIVYTRLKLLKKIGAFKVS